MSKAIVALEDGTIFKGKKFAGSGEASGEIVFNTSLTGYQEILTDPSRSFEVPSRSLEILRDPSRSLETLRDLSGSFGILLNHEKVFGAACLIRI